MKKLVLVLVFVPSVAFAQFFDKGCYRTNNNPDFCHNLEIACQPQGQNITPFGYTAGSLCDDLRAISA
ncbi:MAG: hypothetical protein KDH96_09120 [Candidatus Riesia sp.]|nr:hypothetical protein [Candidatus Riesia sp.]